MDSIPAGILPLPGSLPGALGWIRGAGRESWGGGVGSGNVVDGYPGNSFVLAGGNRGSGSEVVIPAGIGHRDPRDRGFLPPELLRCRPSTSLRVTPLELQNIPREIKKDCIRCLKIPMFGCGYLGIIPPQKKFRYLVAPVTPQAGIPCWWMEIPREQCPFVPEQCPGAGIPHPLIPPLALARSWWDPGCRESPHRDER